MWFKIHENTRHQMPEIHLLLLVLPVKKKKNLSSPLSCLQSDKNYCSIHLPHSWVEVDKNKQHSGLVQSLHRLLVEFLAPKYTVSPDNSEVFFSVVFHISIRFRK